MGRRVTCAGLGWARGAMLLVLLVLLEVLLVLLVVGGVLHRLRFTTERVRVRCHSATFAGGRPRTAPCAERVRIPPPAPRLPNRQRAGRGLPPRVDTHIAFSLSLSPRKGSTTPP